MANKPVNMSKLSLDMQQMLDFLEIMEDRHDMKSTIIVSQLTVVNWYDMMKANTTAADAILDRIMHTAQRFELFRSSRRQKIGKTCTDSENNH